MTRSIGWGLVALGVLLPGAARAQWSFRAGVETPLYSHVSQDGISGSSSIGDSFQPTLDVVAGYGILPALSLDLEFRRGLGATGTGYRRLGTFLGPGVTLDVPAFPLFGRASLPIQLEDSAFLTLRLAGGLKVIDLAFLRIYLEVTGDFPVAGSGIGFFAYQSFGAGLGLWLKL